MVATLEYMTVGRFGAELASGADADRATLAALAAAGADPAHPVRFVHFLYFRDRDDAVAASRALTRRGGYRTRGLAPDAELAEWAVWAEIEREPTFGNVRAMRRAMDRITAHHDGDYDGWEATIPAPTHAGTAEPAGGDSNPGQDRS